MAENPEAPEGRHIELNIVRLPAIASSPKPDSLFILTGGPGEAATDLVERLPPLFRDANRQRDLVFVDQRGTGESNPLDCAPKEPMDYSLSAQESQAMQDSLLRGCLAGYDADLRFYTTPYAMDDINRVREALDYDHINLWGGSYGTRAALVYMRRHPDTVRSAVLDSLAPIGIQLPHHALVDADTALRNLFGLCEQDAACQQRFGDLESTTRQLVADLDDRPRRVSVEHPLTQERIQLNVSGQWLASLIRLALYQRDLGPILPLAIESAAAGDFRPFVLLLTLAEDLSESISIGMQITILCAEDVTRPAPEHNLERASILQLDMLDGMRATCEFWPRGELPEDYFEPVYSDAPVLLLSGELDPVTPPRWADYAGRTLPNSRHIRVPGAHHVSSNTGCLNDLIIEFIDAPSAANLDTECVQAIEPFPPFVSRAGPAMSKRDGDNHD
ncbi:MAG: alpha/beta hydrolase [Cellvibrionaceae bacterium]